MEIERKFLLDRELFWDLVLHDKLFDQTKFEIYGIRQAYFLKKFLLNWSIVARFRVKTTYSVSSKDFFITYKKGTDDPRVRTEHEIALPWFIGYPIDALLSLMNAYGLRNTFTAYTKLRTVITYADKVWEIDEFTNHDFVIAEIELSDPDEQFVLLPGIIREVTNEPEYQNVNL